MPKFILLKPQMGENIGAVARIMSNFGFYDLRIVSPRDGWPNDKAIATAAHGEAIIRDAKLYNSIDDAINDLQIVMATTANIRNSNKSVITPEIAANEIKHYHDIGCKVGIIFGRESSGLSNDELNFASKIITISTSLDNKSLNLAQSAAIIAYELSKISLLLDSNINKRNDDIITYRESEIFIAKLIKKLENHSFFRIPEKKSQLIAKIRNIILQSQLSNSDLRLLHGVVNALTKKNVKN